MVLTFGLFLHRVESHIAVAPNNVRGKDLGAACLCLLLLCRGRNMTHITESNQQPQSAGTPHFFAALSGFPVCITMMMEHLC